MCIDPFICVFQSGGTTPFDAFHCRSESKRPQVLHGSPQVWHGCIEHYTHQTPVCTGFISAAPRGRQAHREQHWALPGCGKRWSNVCVLGYTQKEPWPEFPCVKRKAGKHGPGDETRQAEGVFWPICAVPRNAVLDEWKKQGILRELEVRGLVWDVLLSVQNLQEELSWKKQTRMPPWSLKCQTLTPFTFQMLIPKLFGIAFS